ATTPFRLITTTTAASHGVRSALLVAVMALGCTAGTVGDDLAALNASDGGRPATGGTTGGSSTSSAGVGGTVGHAGTSSVGAGGSTGGSVDGAGGTFGSGGRAQAGGNAGGRPRPRDGRWSRERRSGEFRQDRRSRR